MKKIVIEVKADHDNLPVKKTEFSVGFDLKAMTEAKIVGNAVKIENTDEVLFTHIDYIEYDTQIKIAPELEYNTTILPRSSISSKSWLVLANSEGVIDGDFRGNLLVRFRYIFQPSDLKIINGVILGTVNLEKIFKKGDDIAQLLVHENLARFVEFQKVDELDSTVRGEGGFGSTDVAK